MNFQLNYRAGFTTLLFSLMFLSCSSGKKNARSDAHTSQSSLDWTGSYRGLLPCADCEGIETVIDLNSDYTYQLHQKYLGKGVGLQNTSGTFSWTENGSKLVLKVSKVNQQIQVGENRLFWLDQDGKRITGALADHYILTKQENTIMEKYWKLVTLIGEPVKTTGSREAHIILKQEGARLTGHGGCNAINGSYLLKGHSSISFSNIASTEMSCSAMPVEQGMIQALQSASSYLLKGDTLILQKEQMAPLARFEAVYLR